MTFDPGVRRPLRWGPPAGALLAVIAGLVAFYFSDYFKRSSYDVPFAFNEGVRPPQDIVVIYLDEISFEELEQNKNEPWDRRLHADLVFRLSREGARAIFFDIIFDEPWSNPETDEWLAKSFAAHQAVFIGSADAGGEQFGAASVVRELRPIPPLRQAARWGNVILRPIDSDFGVRQIYSGWSYRDNEPLEVPPLTWQLADELGSPFVQDLANRRKVKWINYLPPTSLGGAGQETVSVFNSVSYSQTVFADGVPPGFFTDKIVFIGLRPARVATADAGKDAFNTPYGFMSGVEVHATIFWNLFQGSWLEKLPDSVEIWIVVLSGLFSGFVLSLFRPFAAFGLGLLIAGTIAAIGIALPFYERQWFTWLVPVMVQVPVAVIWSAGWQYVTEYRRQSALLKAFAHYLSPDMAQAIANSDFDLKPGGRVTDVSVMFTDLEGFTTFSETREPDEVSRILIDYFTKTTSGIFEHKGTIIKYIGDAVLATWNAPLEDADHAYHAVLAGQNLARKATLEVGGLSLRTRIGIHTGEGLVGNLGSEQRFDYTVIGDVVNTASRLEGLNKFLGTNVLISQETYSRLEGRVPTRPLGKVLLKGKSQPLEIHEILEPEHANEEWLSYFVAGIRLFDQNHYDQAAPYFERAHALRAPHGDAPSQFFLAYIADYNELVASTDAPPQWPGVLVLRDK